MRGFVTREMGLFQLKRKERKKERKKEKAFNIDRQKTNLFYTQTKS